MKNIIVLSLLFATSFCFAQNISSSSYALDIFKKNGTIAIMVGSTMYVVQIKTTDKGDDATLAAQAALSVGIKGSNYKYQYHKTMDCNSVKNKFSSVFTIYCSELSTSEPKTTYVAPTAQTTAPTIQKKVFTGTIVNGKKQGKGIYTDNYGRIIEGEFIDDLVNGDATEKGPHGGIYEGYFVKGIKKGKGKMTFSDGSTSEGDFDNGTRNGFGFSIYKDGDKYEGNFVNDLYQGKGKYTYADGSVYEGDFIKAYKSGNGVFRHRNGDVYEGEFILDKYNGNGKLIKKSGYYAIGIFKNGIPVKVKYYNPSNEKVSKSEYEKN